MGKMSVKEERFYKEKIRSEFSDEMMLDINHLNLQNKILYGTFGYHDSEPPHCVIHRKLQELKDNGKSF